MIDHQLGRNQVDKALAHLVFAARQSGADPPRFAHPVWRRRPVASWRRVANTGPRPPSSASSKQGRARGGVPGYSDGRSRRNAGRGAVWIRLTCERRRHPRAHFSLGSWSRELSRLGGRCGAAEAWRWVGGQL
jgi:hypothetical protein